MNKEMTKLSEAGTGSLRDEHRRITNARITEAAKKLFEKQGYRATSLNDIVRAAGTTVTTFYRHFKSKSSLAGIIQHELYAAVELQVARLDHAKTLDDIRNWLDGYVVMWRQMHLLCDAYWEATLTDETLRRSIIPDTMSLTAKLETLMCRFANNENEHLRARMEIRLSMIVLTLDRIAYLADSENSESQRKILLDEFAIVMYRALSEVLPNSGDIRSI